MRTPPLSEGAATVLRAATATDTTVRLPDEQLARPVYEEVNKALTRIGGGGKWNRRQRVHLFPRDPRPELAALLTAGVMPVDQDKLASFFQTPRALADRMVALAKVTHNDMVLEPSAGLGDIAAAVRRRSPVVELRCVEVDPHRATALRDAGFEVREGRFQDYAGQCQWRFTKILMNPPFTESGDPLAWATHIELAMTLLAPSGTLVTIAPVSLVSRRGHRFDTLRAALDVVEELPADTFKDAGTNARTVLTTSRR
jgi:hypothetical protein